MQRYVLGFAFDSNCRVALVRKDRPQWMAGKWNGIGGKIEPGEPAIAAMVREFAEETGVHSPESVWQHFATMRDVNGGHEIVCYVTLWNPEDLDLVRTMESEEIRIFDGDLLTRDDIPMMSNLRWLIPMSLTLAENEIPALIEFAHKLPQIA